MFQPGRWLIDGGLFMAAENTAGKQRGRPFTKGRSGNPTGKPRGARHRATLAAEALLDGEAEALTRKAIELALAGDPIALRLCLDRILPPRRERTLKFVLPELRSTADAGSAMAAILAAVAAGHACLAEAGEFAKLVEGFIRAAEAGEKSQLQQSADYLFPALDFDR
jgi:hypothetical protein